MITEYIDRIKKQHHLVQAEWIEEQVRDALGPVRWWLIETTNWMWLARKFDVTIHVRMVPDAELVIIKKKGVEIAQREFTRTQEAS